MNDKILKFYEDLGLINNKMIKYFDKNSTYVDINEKDNISFIGCLLKEKDGILKKIKIILPKGNTLEETLMQVHEVGHFIDAYKYLGMEYKEDISCEIFPIAMERIFIEDSHDLELISWFNNYQYKLIKKALKENNEKNIIGFLNHFDYVDLYRKVYSLPEIINFKTYNFINPKEELKEKAKILRKKI